MAGLSDVSLEPVISVNLQCHISLSMYNKQKRISMYENSICLQDSPFLKAGIVFAPHGSSEHILHGNKTSSVVAVVDREQICQHTDIPFERVEEIMLPKAIDYFCQNSEASVYQMIWMSEHGSALLQVEKATIRTRRTFARARKTKDRIRELGVGYMIVHLLNLWWAYAPVRLQSLLMDWMQKEKEGNLAAPQKF
jgi:hypothetical protein